MGIASIALALLIISTSTFILIFPIYQITFAQGNETQSAVPSSSLDTVIAGIVSGGVIGAAASLIGTYLNNRHNMNVKKQELRHDIGIELLKHRLESYYIAFKLTEQIRFHTERQETDEIEKLASQLENWYYQDKGGLLMSHDSTARYYSLIRLMLLVVKKRLSQELSEKSDQTVDHSEERNFKLGEKAEEFKWALQTDIGVHEELPKS